MPGKLYIVWSDKRHTTNIPIIDEQHRTLVSMINSLFFLSQNQHAPKAIRLILGGLQLISETHFLTEEMLMEMTGYPDLEEHKKIHESLHTRLKILLSQSRKSLNSDSLLSFLNIWWKEHVAVRDMEYVDHVLKGLRRLGKL